MRRDSWSTPDHFDPGKGLPGHLVDPAGPWAWARVAPEFWAPPRTIGPQNESPGRGGQNRGPWEPRRSGLGELVDPVRPRTNARVTRFRWSTLQARGTALETPGTAGRHHGPSDKGPRPRTAGRPHGPSGPVPSHPGELFNPAGNRTRATRPRELLVPAGRRTQARVARESWSDQLSWAILQALGSAPESPGISS